MQVKKSILINISHFEPIFQPSDLVDQKSQWSVFMYYSSDDVTSLTTTVTEVCHTCAIAPHEITMLS